MTVKLLRIVYIAVAYFLLWVKPTSSFSFFTGVFIFSFGFLLDYSTNYHGGYRHVGIFGSLLSAGFVFIALLGLCGIIQFTKVGNEYFLQNCVDFMLSISINVRFLLIGLFIFAVLAGMEFAAFCLDGDSGIEKSEGKSLGFGNK